MKGILRKEKENRDVKGFLNDFRNFKIYEQKREYFGGQAESLGILLPSMEKRELVENEAPHNDTH